MLAITRKRYAIPASDTAARYLLHPYRALLLLRSSLSPLFYLQVMPWRRYHFPPTICRNRVDAPVAHLVMHLRPRQRRRFIIRKFLLPLFWIWLLLSLFKSWEIILSFVTKKANHFLQIISSNQFNDRVRNLLSLTLSPGNIEYILN